MLLKKRGGEMVMNSQMEQFFKFMLAFVMVIILGSVITGYLKDNFSTFTIEETSENESGTDQ